MLYFNKILLLYLFTNVTCESALHFVRNYKLFFDNNRHALNISLEWKYPAISNLKDIISSMSSQHCLITVDNFRSVNIQSDNPIFVRVIGPIVYHLQGLTTGSRKIGLHGPKSLPSQNVTEHSPRNCPLSKYLTDLKNSEELEDLLDICLQLNLTRYWGNVKPWNCHFQLFLYPPWFYYDSALKWHHFYTNYNPHSAAVFPPRFVKSILTLVHEEPCIIRKDLRNGLPTNVNNIANIILSRYYRDKNAFCSEAFIFATVPIQHALSSIQSYFHFGNITRVQLFRGCRRWGAMISTPLFDIRKDQIYAMEELTVLSSPPPNFTLDWFLKSLPNNDDTLMVNMALQLNNCNKMAPLKSTSLHENVVHRLAFLYAHVWLSIMGNYTLTYEQEKLLNSCGSEKQNRNVQRHTDVSLIPYFKSLFYSSYFFEDNLSRLQFVSCGDKGLSSIPVELLTNVFDFWIWLHIVASFVIILLLYRLISDISTTRHACWLSPLKVLLEQGDPFSNLMLKGTPAKLISIIFLLLGIILSNAYKNSNVYNMITPRRPIPYESFNELIKDGFTVYTRVSNLRLGKFKYEYMDDFNAGSYHQLHHQGVTMLVLSEMATYLARVTKTFRSFNLNQTYNVITDTKTLNITELAGIAKLNPSVKAIVDSWEWWHNGHNYLFYTSIENERIKLIDEESIILSKKLEKCKKVAAVLPEHLCRNHSTNLRKKWNSVFIGKEYMSDVEWRLQLQGLVPPHIPKRIKSAHESGLWTRWEQLLKRSTDTIWNAVVAAAKLDGNVIVIFCVWICGIILSVISIMLELMYGHANKIWQYFVTIVLLVLSIKLSIFRNTILWRKLKLNLMLGRIELIRLKVKWEK